MESRNEIREKREEMYNLYGHAMSLSDLCRATGMGRVAAREWAQKEGLGQQYGKRITYETAQVAKRIVQLRGMY